jgi:hypothetical protein
MSTRTAPPVRRRLAAIAAAAAALLAGTAGPAAAQSRAPTSTGGARAVSGGSWGKAIEVPGTAALNADGNADVNSVSCASAGNCSAGGGYLDSSIRGQAFVVSQVSGRWGKAIEVPGSAALNAGGNAVVTSVSCASAGNCSAAGTYGDSSGHGQAFVVGEVNGRWGTAVEVPGTAALNTGGHAALSSLSCGAAGNCSAGGQYKDSSGHTQVFVVSQVNGRWGKAIEVPGSAALNTGGGADVSSVSCGAAGNCSAGGYYLHGSSSTGSQQAFVVSQVNGKWGKAIEVPGTAVLNTGGSAQVSSVSCATAGNCSAGGTYFSRSTQFLGFVVSQVNGRWGKAIEIPGTRGDTAFVNSVSCASAGNCSAGGSYFNPLPEAFVVSQVNGRWGTAVAPTTGAAKVFSVSCATAGNCSAGGQYYDSSGRQQAFVASQVNGRWGKTIEVPGSAALNTGGAAGVSSVSCATAGHCSAGGAYLHGSSTQQAFVVSQS